MYLQFEEVGIRDPFLSRLKMS